MSRQKNSKTVTPEQQENESLPTSAPSSPPMPAAPSSDTSSKAPATEDPHSYRPPGVDRSTPTLPHSETEENQSSMKSVTRSRSRKTSPEPDQRVSSEPKKDTVLGSGGLDWLEYAVVMLQAHQFRDLYEHRAGWLLKHHGEKLSPAARLKLEALLPE